MIEYGLWMYMDVYIYIYMDALYMAVSIKKKQKVMASCVVSECL